MIYVLILIVGFIITYLFMHRVLFPVIFEKPLIKLNRRFFYSSAIIAIITLANYLFIVHFFDINVGIGNRLLHAVGGGFVGSLLCFLVVKDGRLAINKWQFLIITALIVTALGVANELYEFVLQMYFHHISSATVIDTWQDLTSNTVGIIISLIVLMPFINNKKKSNFV